MGALLLMLLLTEVLQMILRLMLTMHVVMTGAGYAVMTVIYVIHHCAGGADSSIHQGRHAAVTQGATHCRSSIHVVIAGVIWISKKSHLGIRL